VVAIVQLLILIALQMIAVDTKKNQSEKWWKNLEQVTWLLHAF